MALLKHKLIYKMSGLMTWYGRLLLVIWLCYQCNVLLVEAKVSSSSKRARGSSKAKRTSSNNIVKDNKAEDDAFVMLAEYASRYARGKTGALRDFEQDEVTRAVAALASAQQAWKSMDGATHSLKNTFKER